MNITYGKWKSQVEKYTNEIGRMKIWQFPEYDYKGDYESGLSPKESALKIFEKYSFKMEFEEN